MSASVESLKIRSDLLCAVRLFFLEREFVEVETPLLFEEVIPELYIEPVRVDHDGLPQWLQASPELHMKRLLVQGLEANFQVTRSFRGGERGPLHTPEFTILEWYRVGDGMHAGINLLDDLLQAILMTKPATRTSYAEAFKQHTGVDPHRATCEELASKAAELDIVVPAEMSTADRDEWLNLMLALKVEPELGRSNPEILYDYPESQAALAKIALRDDGNRVAERFELYCQGVELANGYHELTDSRELRQRLVRVNEARAADGREPLPLPESLFAAMQEGLPACAGCALGFDRLVMLACGAESIDDVVSFPEK